MNKLKGKIMKLKYIMLLTVIIGISVQAKASELPPTPFSTQELQTACEHIHVYNREFELNGRVAEYSVLENLLKEYCILPLRYPKAFKSKAERSDITQFNDAAKALYKKIHEKKIKINKYLLIVYPNYSSWHPANSSINDKGLHFDYTVISYPNKDRDRYGKYIGDRQFMGIYESSKRYLRNAIKKYKDDIAKKTGF